MIRALFLIASILMCSILNADTPEQWWKKLPRQSWSRFEKIPQSQNWFEVYRIQPGLYAIYEPGQWEEVISYLIVGSKKSVLFDTGLGIADIKKLIGELTPVEPVVINSHSHYDHVGGNFQFHEIYGMDLEFSRLNSKGTAHDGVKEFVSEGWIWKETPKGFAAKDYTIKPYQVTKILQNGDSIDLGDRILEVILTPGHTPDSLCLLDRKNRLLLTGDTFYPAPLYAHFPESNFKQYVETAALLHKLKNEVDYLVSAHNETLLPSSYLEKLYKAFVAIQEGSAKYKDQKDGIREYLFDGFSILVKKP